MGAKPTRQKDQIAAVVAVLIRMGSLKEGLPETRWSAKRMKRLGGAFRLTRKKNARSGLPRRVVPNQGVQILECERRVPAAREPDLSFSTLLIENRGVEIQTARWISRS